ncbi:TIR domain-containing protein [Mesorhizobium sp. LHD-90]|uniref:TIR domain-containing protein n=1 Tax=Mesorhizobium sp. LHD-90 TaxID=3071414 RepID=UPI0027DFC96A|nr:TIR domain-containing protein [Mesorhizobium sp. LHD-90]MDQ6436875.1 TIR domain-containing protein [Mesorhizobium sp. LHD-90]
MKIFLGYPSEHEKVAWKVYGFLNEKGDDVWFDKESLVAGTDWDRERDKGQREAELVIHLCSEAILKRSGVVNREIRQTLRLVEDQPLGALYVIPIRLEPIKLPVELTRFQYFDFGDDWKERLSEGVEKRRAQLSGDAPKPPRQQTVIEQRSLKGSQKIEFDDITKSYECRGEYLHYDEEGLYWTYLNGAIASEVLEGFYGARSDFKRLFVEDGEEMNENGQKHEWSISTEEFFRSDDMLSLRFYSYIGFVGAAHPNHYITTLNFFGEDAGSLDIQNLLGHSAEFAQRVIAYCEKIILAEFEGEIGKNSFFEGYKETEDDLWKLLGQFGFDRKGLTFNFSPYDVLPFVFGSHEVQVPWRFLEGLISDDYKDIIEKLTNRQQAMPSGSLREPFPQEGG